jgi:hypothetical protein
MIRVCLQDDINEPLDEPEGAQHCCDHDPDPSVQRTVFEHWWWVIGTNAKKNSTVVYQRCRNENQGYPNQEDNAEMKPGSIAQQEHDDREKGVFSSQIGRKGDVFSSQENQAGKEDKHVAADDDNAQPDRHTPMDDQQNDKRGGENLVCNGVKGYTEPTDLAHAPGQISVQSVGYARDSHKSDTGHDRELVGASQEIRKERNQCDSRETEEVGNLE